MNPFLVPFIPLILFGKVLESAQNIARTNQELYEDATRPYDHFFQGLLVQGFIANQRMGASLSKLVPNVYERRV